jgi:hypothetical protein
MMRRHYRRQKPFAWGTAATFLIAVLIVAWILTQTSVKIWPGL